jgi:hypothetical protein
MPCRKDFHQIMISEACGQPIGLFGVFDGYNGSQAAKHVQTHFFHNLLMNLDFDIVMTFLVQECYGSPKNL